MAGLVAKQLSSLATLTFAADGIDSDRFRHLQGQNSGKNVRHRVRRPGEARRRCSGGADLRESASHRAQLYPSCCEGGWSNQISEYPKHLQRKNQ